MGGGGGWWGRGVGGGGWWGRGVGVVGVGRKPEEVIPSSWTVLSSYARVQELLVIGLDKPERPKRHFTNTGVNIRPILPI